MVALLTAPPLAALLTGPVLSTLMLMAQPATGVTAPAALPAASAPPSAGSARPSAGSAPSPAGGAVWPLRPRPEVVTGFSPPADPWGAGHRGADLLGDPGQQVRSAQAGTVSYVGTIAGVGIVVVRHGTTRSTYQPVSATVHVGEQVTAGQSLGTLELFGSHCFPRACLHWGLLEGEVYLDPLDLVGAAPVRLLPLGPPGA
jgi:murein DD-endopeptidase MepM/ murein hydrolase activator NlpD